MPRLALTALEPREVPALIGALDPSFSPNAPAGITDVVAARQFVDVAIQQDGKLVAVSDVGPDFIVTRFNVDGSLDTTFGTGGTKTIDIQGNGQFDTARGVAIDAQNRVVVVGDGGAAVENVALVRLDPNGQTVQINTSVHIGNVADGDTARAVAFQTDGTIVVAGNAQVGGDRDLILVRFDPATGAKINSVTIDYPVVGDNETGNAVAVYQTGPNQNKVVIAGTTSNAGVTDIAVAQRNADLTSDDTFVGAGGRKQIDVSGNDIGTGVAITEAGSIVVSGRNGAADRDLVVAQLLPTGAFDGAFNGGAVRTLTRAGNESAPPHNLALQDDGKIVVVADTTGGDDVGVFRLNPNGTDDTSFGPNGQQKFDVNGNDDANAVVVDGSGRIVVAGDDTASAGFLLRVTGSLGLPAGVAASGTANGAAPVFESTGTQLGTTPIATPTAIAGSAVNAVLADVNGDGTPDLIAGVVAGGDRVVILNGRDATGATVLASFQAFGGFGGGVFVAAGDLNNDGRADVVVTPVLGGLGPRVAVFSGASLSTGGTAKLADFNGIADAVTGAADNSAGTIALVGARVAVGDVNADGIPDLAVAAGRNGGPRVTIWDGKNVASAPGAGTPAQPPLANAFVFEDTQRDGAFVTLGDVTSDGRADLIAGGGPNGGPRVRIGDMAPILAAKNFGTFDSQLGVVKSNFFAGDPNSRGGIRVSARDIDGDGIADLVTGSGDGLATRVQLFAGTKLVTFTGGVQTADQSFDPFSTTLAGGVYVG